MRTSFLSGFLDLINDSPNSWEKPIKRKAHIHVLWPENNVWNCRYLFTMNPGEIARLQSFDFDSEMGDRNVVFLYPSKEILPVTLAKLPSNKYWFSEIPAWRNTSGFFNSHAQVSYQSDVEPLPLKASLLTFHPFIQYGPVSNFLVVLNLVEDPLVNTGPIHFFRSHDKSWIGTESIRTNSVTTIPLDNYGISATELPVFFSPTIAGIPFGLGVNEDGSMLSLEHTHPPASFVLFGNRRITQGNIKKRWIDELSKHI